MDLHDFTELNANEDLFKDVRFFLTGVVSDLVKKLLTKGGAKQEGHITDFMTHLITGSNPDENELGLARDIYEKPAVTHSWVIYSAKCGKQLPIDGFLPDGNQLFSGVKASFSKLCCEDYKSLYCLLTFFDGKCSLNLDQTCTHLITGKPKGKKYEFAVEKDVLVVTPDWIIESVLAGEKKEEFFYHPRLLNTSSPPYIIPRKARIEPKPQPLKQLSIKDISFTDTIIKKAPVEEKLKMKEQASLFSSLDFSDDEDDFSSDRKSLLGQLRESHSWKDSSIGDSTKSVSLANIQALSPGFEASFDAVSFPTTTITTTATTTSTTTTTTDHKELSEACDAVDSFSLTDIASLTATTSQNIDETLTSNIDSIVSSLAMSLASASREHKDDVSIALDNATDTTLPITTCAFNKENPTPVGNEPKNFSSGVVSSCTQVSVTSDTQTQSVAESSNQISRHDIALSTGGKPIAKLCKEASLFNPPTPVSPTISATGTTVQPSVTLTVPASAASGLSFHQLETKTNTPPISEQALSPQVSQFSHHTIQATPSFHTSIPNSQSPSLSSNGSALPVSTQATSVSIVSSESQNNVAPAAAPIPSSLSFVPTSVPQALEASQQVQMPPNLMAGNPQSMAQNTLVIGNQGANLQTVAGGSNVRYPLVASSTIQSSMTSAAPNETYPAETLPELTAAIRLPADLAPQLKIMTKEEQHLVIEQYRQKQILEQQKRGKTAGVQYKTIHQGTIRHGSISYQGQSPVHQVSQHPTGWPIQNRVRLGAPPVSTVAYSQGQPRSQFQPVTVPGTQPASSLTQPSTTHSIVAQGNSNRTVLGLANWQQSPQLQQQQQPLSAQQTPLSAPIQSQTMQTIQQGHPTLQRAPSQQIRPSQAQLRHLQQQQLTQVGTHQIQQTTQASQEQVRHPAQQIQLSNQSISQQQLTHLQSPMQTSQQLHHPLQQQVQISSQQPVSRAPQHVQQLSQQTQLLRPMQQLQQSQLQQASSPQLPQVTLQQQLLQSGQQQLQQPTPQQVQPTIQQLEQLKVQQPDQQPGQQPSQAQLQQPGQQPSQVQLQQPVLKQLQQSEQPIQQQQFQQPPQQQLQQPAQQQLQQPAQQQLQQSAQQQLQQPSHQQLQQSAQHGLQQSGVQLLQQPTQKPIQQPATVQVQQLQQSTQQQLLHPTQPLQRHQQQLQLQQTHQLQQPTQQQLQQSIQQQLQPSGQNSHQQQSTARVGSQPLQPPQQTLVSTPQHQQMQPPPPPPQVQPPNSQVLHQQIVQAPPQTQVQQAPRQIIMQRHASPQLQQTSQSGVGQPQQGIPPQQTPQFQVQALHLRQQFPHLTQQEAQQLIHSIPTHLREIQSRDSAGRLEYLSQLDPRERQVVTVVTDFYIRRHQQQLLQRQQLQAQQQQLKIGTPQQSPTAWPQQQQQHQQTTPNHFPPVSPHARQISSRPIPPGYSVQTPVVSPGQGSPHMVQGQLTPHVSPLASPHGHSPIQRSEAAMIPHPALQGSNVPQNLVNQQNLVNPKTKTALANLLTNRLSGTIHQGSVLPQGPPGQIDVASHVIQKSGVPAEQAQGSSTEQVLVYQRRTTLGNITGTVTNNLVRPPAPVAGSHAHNLTPVGAATYPRPGGAHASGAPSVMASAAPHYPRPLLYGHDINMLPRELCMVGCVFYIADYHGEITPDTVNSWKRVIQLHGGEIVNTYDSSRVTHFLCKHQKSPLFQQAVRDNKRCITIEWVNDILIRGKMAAPWQAIHLPTPFGTNEQPLKDMIISITGFENEERISIRLMMELAGAKYTGYFSRHNHVLVCKKFEGSKVSKAREYKRPVVNGAWLSEVLLGQNTPPLVYHATRYQAYLEDPLTIDSSLASHLLLNAWKFPISVSKELVEKAKAAREMVLRKRKSEKEGDQENKRSRLDPPQLGAVPATSASNQQTTAPTAVSSTTTVSTAASLSPLLNMDSKNIAKNLPLSTIKNSLSEFQKPKILLSSIKNKEEIERKILEMGGSVARTNAEATHLVVGAEAVAPRTVKLMCAISCCQFIVGIQWLLDSYAQLKFLAEVTYTLKMPDYEKIFEFELLKTLQKPDRRRLLSGKTFYLTPSVIPGRVWFREIIECAGGFVDLKRKSLKNIGERNKNECQYICITAEKDVHLIEDLLQENMPVFNPEFVMKAILTQIIDHEFATFPRSKE